MAAPSLSTAVSSAEFKRPQDTSPNAIARDEAFWREVAGAYDVKRDIVNLENGNWGVMARPVAERYMAHTAMVNRDNSYYARRQYKDAFQAVYARVAGALGVDAQEIALTRGATEALKAIITGYNKLKPGEAVMYADLDYGSIQAAMDWRANASGCSVVKLSVPEPASYDGVIAFYRRALSENPDVRLLLLTHVSHRTGLVMPVREIADMARRAGVDCVVDAAHSWGQINFKAHDLGADYIGFNLHKWMGAPIGVGVAYISADALETIDPDPSASAWERDHTFGRIHTGTANYAAFLTVPDALDFHEQIGAQAKAARLSYLRDQWVEDVRTVSGLDILTPEDARMHAGITSFRFEGKTSVDDNVAVAARLLDEFGVYTVHRTGVAAGACVRATPAVYNSNADVAALAAALKRF